MDTQGCFGLGKLLLAAYSDAVQVSDLAYRQAGTTGVGYCITAGT